MIYLSLLSLLPLLPLFPLYFKYNWIESNKLFNDSLVGYEFLKLDNTDKLLFNTGDSLVR